MSRRAIVRDVKAPAGWQKVLPRGLQVGDEIRVFWTDAASVAGAWRSLKMLREWKAPLIETIGALVMVDDRGLFYGSGRDLHDTDPPEEQYFLAPGFIPGGCIEKVEVTRRANKKA